MSLSSQEWPSWPSSQIVSDNEALVGDTLYAILKVEAYNLQIAAELLATRNEIQKLVSYFIRDCQADKDIPLLKTWRRELVGAKLISILEGMQVQIKLDLKQEPSVQIFH